MTAPHTVDIAGSLMPGESLRDYKTRRDGSRSFQARRVSVWRRQARRFKASGRNAR